MISGGTYPEYRNKLIRSILKYPFYIRWKELYDFKRTNRMPVKENLSLSLRNKGDEKTRKCICANEKRRFDGASNLVSIYW